MFAEGYDKADCVKFQWREEKYPKKCPMLAIRNEFVCVCVCGLENLDGQMATVWYGQTVKFP